MRHVSYLLISMLRPPSVADLPYPHALLYTMLLVKAIYYKSNVLGPPQDEGSMSLP